MKILLALILNLFFNSILFSQYFNHEDFYLNSSNDLYSLNYLNTQSSGMGFTGIAKSNDISGVVNNPASIEIPGKFQINAQYSFKGKHNFSYTFFGEDYSIKHQLFSGSAGFGWKISKYFQTGFIYNNPRGYYYDLGEMIRTNEFGDPLDTIDYYISTKFHSFNIPFVYRNDNFSIALNADYILGMVNIPGGAFTTINEPNGYNSGNDFSATVNWVKLDGGIKFKISPHFNAGLTVSTGMKSNVVYKYPDGSEEHSMATMPWKGGVGIMYSFPNSTWKLGSDFVYERTSAIKYYKDRFNVHIGTEGYISKNWILRAGAFTLLDNRKEEEGITYSDKIGEYDQYFITFGASYLMKKAVFNLAILSSHISPGTYQGFIINGGVTFNF